MSTPDQSTLDLTDDVEKALQSWIRTRKAITIGAAWTAGVEWGRAHPALAEQTEARASFWHECEHFKGYTFQPDFQCPKCSESEEVSDGN